MSSGDIVPYNDGNFGKAGGVDHQVVAGGTPPAINAGEMVLKTLGNQYVIAMSTSKPVVATDFIGGISETASTETSTVDGKVKLTPYSPGQIWLISPKTVANYGLTAGSFNQTTYNAKVGQRVTIDVTSGVLTINSTDGSTNGCVVENLDIFAFPGKVAFSIRAAAYYTA